MLKRNLTGVFVVCVLSSMVPAIASAQARRGAAAPDWYVGGLGGVTFGTATSGAFGGQFGFRLAPSIYVIGEIGQMRNVLPKALRDDFDADVDLIALASGVPVTAEIRLPATYGFGGVRWEARSRGRAKAFVEGGVGVGHISLHLDKVTILGIDVTNEVADDIDTSDSNATKFLLALGGGVDMSVTRTTSVDAGYRYTRIATQDPSINSSMVYVAIKVHG